MLAHEDELYLGEIDEPKTFAEAEEGAWRRAMDEEMASIVANKTWRLTELPAGHKAIGLKWVYKLKRDAGGNVQKHKACLVAKGFVQKQGVDFEEVFAPVARLESVRLLVALAAHEGWRVHHMDVKSAFLNGDLKEEVYVMQPPGYAIDGEEHKVLRLDKALYGLRQAPRAWNAKLDRCLLGLGFTRSPSEHAVYGRGRGTARLLVGVYVDDLIITGNNDDEISKFKMEMQRLFCMIDLGLLSFYLGIEVKQTTNDISLSQAAYAGKIIEKAGLVGCNPSHTPMEPRFKLSRVSSAPATNATAYRSVVGALRYLVHTCPDLTFSVGYVSRFMEAPTEEHRTAVKHILRYIAGTLHLGSKYGRGDGEPELTRYNDSDLGGDVDTRKSTSGTLFLLGGVITWQS